MQWLRNRGMIAGLAALLVLVPGPALFAQNTADHRHDGHPSLASPYVGEENRAIATLSEDDIRQLENGEGWGLAKAAELNGVPGPAHLLEMAEEDAIHLTGDQLAQVRDLYDAMKARAIPVGRRLIDLERELNRLFADGGMAPDDLEHLLERIGETTAELRYVHLVTHLETSAILGAHQVRMYNQVRGYVTPESVDRQ